MSGRGLRAFRRPRKARLGLWMGLGIAVLIVAYAGVLVLSQPHVGGRTLTLTDFTDKAQGQDVVSAKILDVDGYVVGTYINDAGKPAKYNTPYLKENTERLLGILLSAHVPTSIDQQNGKRAASLATILLPGLVIILLFVYLVLSYRRGTGLFSVRSGARKMGSAKTGVTFADVAGQGAAIAEIREVAEFLASPEKFTGLGATIPKGILLFGPPGCGKTLLARALAGEAGASFFSISGSDFVELYAGVGAARVRDLFREAHDHVPAIVFIDELDAVGRSRAGGAPGMVGATEQEQALNQILTAMDGFSPSEGIIVVGATNRPDVLDPALLRPGRFDRAVGLERPDESARLDILRLHARGKRLADGVDLAAVASRAIGLTGADLASVMNEAALLAGREGRDSVTQAELDTALQRILEAPERQRRLALKERSVARRFVAEERVSFADVAGADDAILELAELKDYLAEPDRFADMGARIPKGILLSGPPGCGKTLLARAVAGEANAAFFSVAASEFAERLVGLGAARVRDLFAEARAVAPAIVFIDEIDAVGGARRALVGSDEQEQTLNQLLVELDGFEPRTGVIVIGATNRPDLLDPALRRPGRFDRHVTVTLPDRAGREAILRLHARDKRLGSDVDLGVVAGLTRGFSGADLANVLNEAALLATRKGLDPIPMSIVDESIDRAVLGLSSRAVVLSDEERRVVAYHEAGHAVVADALAVAALPHRVTIVGKGPVLGQCSVLDAHDRVVLSFNELHDRMAVALGGRCAELLVFGQASSGAGGDLQRVGDLARHMVRDLGMSDAIGPLAYDQRPEGQSPEATRLVDEEARRLARSAQDVADKILADRRAALDRVAEALLDRETLTATELQSLLVVN